MVLYAAHVLLQTSFPSSASCSRRPMKLCSGLNLSSKVLQRTQNKSLRCAERRTNSFPSLLLHCVQRRVLNLQSEIYNLQSLPI